MKPYDQPTPQQFLRKNIARFVLYGTVGLGCLWGIAGVVEWQGEDSASAQRVEAAMMDYYRETVGQNDTAGMATYMKQHLSAKDYNLWLEGGKQALFY